MGQISDTLDALDTDTIVDFLESDRKLFVLDPKDIFIEHSQALSLETLIKVVDEGSGVPDLHLILKGHQPTLIRILGLIANLQMRRIDP